MTFTALLLVLQMHINLNKNQSGHLPIAFGMMTVTILKIISLLMAAADFLHSYLDQSRHHDIHFTNSLTAIGFTA